MPSTEAPDDDDLATLLVEDARKSSARYAAQGLSAFLPKRNTGSAPKPNTRFLKSLVRDADSHNTKLREREEAEARERMRKLRQVEGEARGSKRDQGAEKRTDRHNGNERKRRRLSEGGTHERRAHHERLETQRDSRRSHSSERKQRRDRENEGRLRRRNTSSPEDEDYARRRRRRRNSSSAEEDQAQLDRRSRHRSDRKRHWSRSDSRSRSRHRHRKHGRDLPLEEHSSPHTDKSPAHLPPPATMESPRHDSGDRTRPPSSSSASSDPLAPLIGPEPVSSTTAPRMLKRGRGFLRPDNASTASNIDAHFSPTYHPSRDATVSPSPSALEDGDQDEWTSALSALRDRRQYREKQASRMREAGFTEEEISKWDKTATHPSRTLLGGGSDAEGDIRDVRWKKKGEEREWDAGKNLLSFDGASDEETLVDGADTMDHRAQGREKRAAKAKAGGGDEAWRRPQNGLLKQFKSALG